MVELTPRNLYLMAACPAGALITVFGNSIGLTNAGPSVKPLQSKVAMLCTPPNIVPQTEGSVIPAERVRIVQQNARIRKPGFVWHNVQPAFRIGLFMVDGGRDPSHVKRERAGGRFDRARRAHRVPQHRLDGTHRNPG